MLSPRKEADQAAIIGASLALSPNDPILAIEALSGGNQQKVVLGRWLATKRALLICEDPTAGVDVGAKAEIYALLNRALADGVGILIVSTDFEEIAMICHRAIVFSQGAIVDELTGTRLSTENLIQSASAGGARPVKEQDMQSLKSAALEPTKVELKHLSLWRRAMRLLPVYGLVILTVFLDCAVLGAAARHLPDDAEPAGDHLGQGDHCAALAWRDDTDGGWADRSDRRIRHRSVAHSGDQLADDGGLCPGRSR